MQTGAFVFPAAGSLVHAVAPCARRRYSGTFSGAAMRGDTEADILAEAHRTDRAPVRSIHVRSGVARRLHGLAVVVDDTIPFCPGFECHREAP